MIHCEIGQNVEKPYVSVVGKTEEILADYCVISAHIFKGLSDAIGHKEAAGKLILKSAYRGIEMGAKK